MRHWIAIAGAAAVAGTVGFALGIGASAGAQPENPKAPEPAPEAGEPVIAPIEAREVPEPIMKAARAHVGGGVPGEVNKVTCGDLTFYDIWFTTDEGDEVNVEVTSDAMITYHMRTTPQTEVPKPYLEYIKRHFPKATIESLDRITSETFLFYLEERGRAQRYVTFTSSEMPTVQRMELVPEGGRPAHP